MGKREVEGRVSEVKTTSHIMDLVTGGHLRSLMSLPQKEFIGHFVPFYFKSLLKIMYFIALNVHALYIWPEIEKSTLFQIDFHVSQNNILNNHYK